MSDIVFSRDQTKASYGDLDFVFVPGIPGCLQCDMDWLTRCGECTRSTRNDLKSGVWKRVRKGAKHA